MIPGGCNLRMNPQDHRNLNPDNWYNVPCPLEVVEREPSGIMCNDCGEDVNLYSEGETYEWSSDLETGEISYICETCLDQLKQDLVDQGCPADDVL
jgi:hypothetical protein